MIRYLRALTTLLISAFFSSCLASNFDGLTRKVDAFIQAHVPAYYFSGSVLIAKNGEVAFSKSYGMSNYELGTPHTPQTKMRIASLTKHMTAAAILKLQEDGLLKLSDTVDKFLPDYPHGNKISIHQLLTHTSGIASEVESLEDLRVITRGRISCWDFMKRFQSKALLFEPGSDYWYSNANYVVLTAIIEQASGKPYGQYLQETLFKPLGMHNTGLDDPTVLLTNRAAGYDPGECSLRNAEYAWPSNYMGAGGLYSTIEDMGLWITGMHTILTKKSLETMFYPHVVLETQCACYGWFTSAIEGQRMFDFDGYTFGFSSAIIRLPDLAIDIVVLCNFQHGDAPALACNIAKIILGKDIPQPAPVVFQDQPLDDRYIGTYRSSDAVIEITKQEGKLWLDLKEPHRRMCYRLLPIGPDSFVQFGVQKEHLFMCGRGGAEGLKIREQGTEIYFKKQY